MPNSCAVLNCKTVCGGELSSFQVPRDENLRSQWAKAIGVKVLRSNQRICEKHFEKSYVIKENIKYDPDGKPLNKVQRLRAHLKKGAVPTILDDRDSKSTHNCQAITGQNLYYSLDHTYAISSVPELKQHISEKLDDSVVYRQDKDVVECDGSNVNSSDPQLLKINKEFQSQSDTPTHTSEALLNGIHYNTDIVVNSNIEHSDSIIKLEDSDNNCDADTTLHSHVTVKFDHLTFNFVAENDDLNTCLTIPKPWNVGYCKVKEEEALIFSYAANVNNSGKEKHIFEKSVIITSSREIIYEVYMTPIDVTQLQSKFPSHLSRISSLSEILKKFKNIRIYKGIATNNLVIDNSKLQHCIDTHWRHADCCLLSINSDRCKVCKKYSNTLSQKQRRMKKRTSFQRISSCTNPFDRMKMKAMQKQIKSKNEKNKRLKKKMELLTQSISNYQDKIANLDNADLDKVPANQKLIIQEIISAAKVNSRACRYRAT